VVGTLKKADNTFYHPAAYRNDLPPTSYILSEGFSPQAKKIPSIL
jgi:hypothetical protein